MAIRVYKNPPVDSIQSHMDPVHTLEPYLFQTNFNITFSYRPSCTKWAILFRF